jgi:hypothetical protein
LSKVKITWRRLSICSPTNPLVTRAAVGFKVDGRRENPGRST